MGLHKPIAHLSTVLKPDFIVVDHICGDYDFEEGGNPVVRNCIMAALDPVLTDSYACRIIGYTADDVPYIRLAEQLGTGTADLDALEIVHLGSGREGLWDPATRRRAASRVAPLKPCLTKIPAATDAAEICAGMPELSLEKKRLLDKLPERSRSGRDTRKKRHSGDPAGARRTAATTSARRRYARRTGGRRSTGN